jgi:hypothetical protein
MSGGGRQLAAGNKSFKPFERGPTLDVLLILESGSHTVQMCYHGIEGSTDRLVGRNGPGSTPAAGQQTAHQQSAKEKFG